MFDDHSPDLLHHMTQAFIGRENLDGALARLGARFDSARCVAMEHFVDGNDFVLHGGVGISAGCFDQYRRNFAHHSPMVLDYQGRSSLLIYRDTDFLEYDRYLESIAYREYFQPLHLDHLMLLCVGREEGSISSIVFRRSADLGPYRSEEAIELSSMAGSLREAWRIGREAKKKASAMAGLLDYLLSNTDEGIIVIDADLRVHYANGVAEQLIRTTRSVSVRNKSLTIHPAEDHEAVQYALRAAVMDRSDGLDASVPMRIKAGHEDLFLSIIPLPESVHSAFAQRWCAAIRIVRVDPGENSITHALAKAFGLTPKEADFVEMMVQGLSVREIAERGKISVHTARWYVKQLQTKMDCRRQVDIVRLAMTLKRLGY